MTRARTMGSLKFYALVDSLPVKRDDLIRPSLACVAKLRALATAKDPRDFIPRRLCRCGHELEADKMRRVRRQPYAPPILTAGNQYRGQVGFGFPMAHVPYLFRQRQESR